MFASETTAIEVVFLATATVLELSEFMGSECITRDGATSGRIESGGTEGLSSDTVSFFLVRASQYRFDIERRQSE